MLRCATPLEVTLWVLLATLAAAPAAGFLSPAAFGRAASIGRRARAPLSVRARAGAHGFGPVARDAKNDNAASLLQGPGGRGPAPGALKAATFSMGTGTNERRRDRLTSTVTRPAPSDVQGGVAQAPVPAVTGPVWGLVMPEVKHARRPPLPRLSDGERMRLLAGERIEKQERLGRVGTGIVAVDVEADVSTVMAVLTDLDRYVGRIPTMREVSIIKSGNQVLSAQFCISRFRLEINTDMRVDTSRNMFEFKLDPTRPTMALQEARGFWFVEKAEGRPEGWSRVWLKAMVKCDPLLPTFIVDYAASQALPRASAWLQPVMKEIGAAVKSGGLKDVHNVQTSYVEVDKLKDRFNGVEVPPRWKPGN